MNDPGIIALIVLFVLTQGFFSGSEIALVSADRLRLQADASRGRRAAALALQMLDRPTFALGTCLIGTNLSLIAISTLMVMLVKRHLDLPASAVTLAIVPVTLTLCEMVPKAVYQHHADKLVGVVIFPLRLFSWVFSPVLLVLEAFHRLLSGDDTKSAPPITRQELRLLLEDTPSEDLTESNQQLIRRVFAFTEAVVEQAMVPLIEVSALPITASVEQAAQRISQTGHSRIPIFRDRVDDIVGVVLHQDLLTVEDWSRPVSSIARAAIYVPETKPVDELLLEMQRGRHRMAVAVDEYGGAVGIITVEDMLEEIVGDIEDESDRGGPMVRRTGEAEWIANARAEREHIQAATTLELPDGDFETIAGYLLSVMGRVPTVGDSVRLANFDIIVSRANERAILEVKLRGRG